MKLTDEEKAMLDGRDGPAIQKAMELLVRYGEALGAERLVDTHNVCGAMNAKVNLNAYGSFDAVFSEFNLDSSEAVEIPMAKAFFCQLEQFLDPEHWQIQGITPDLYELNRAAEEFKARIGMHLLCTCAPYLVGNVPIKGEHCAWMESSAVVYINSVIGARSNVEGSESTGAAALTGKIPYWGYHLDKNRLGTHLVEVEWDVNSVMDWGLLGYYVGLTVKDKVPVINGIKRVPSLEKLKHFGAAAASSGGVEMFHIPGVTPEARSVEEAFGSKKPLETLKFGKAERQMAYEHINSAAKDSQVDFIMLGCPHASIKEIWEICKLLTGKKVHSNTALWIFTPRAIREIADRNGYTKIIRDAGAVLMSDTCPVLGQFMPPGTRVAATNSCKQTHYMPSHLGVQCWFGSTEDCINAAITGRWDGKLP
jgi:predicted aconitase